MREYEYRIVYFGHVGNWISQEKFELVLHSMIGSFGIENVKYEKRVKKEGVVNE